MHVLRSRQYVQHASCIEGLTLYQCFLTLPSVRVGKVYTGCFSDRVGCLVNIDARTLAISLQLLPASRMLFSLLSSAGVHGVFVLPFFTTGDDGGSDDCSPASPVPPGSPYVDVAAVVVACCIVELEPGAFRFLEPVGLLNGVSVFSRLVS